MDMFLTGTQISLYWEFGYKQTSSSTKWMNPDKHAKYSSLKNSHDRVLLLNLKVKELNLESLLLLNKTVLCRFPVWKLITMLQYWQNYIL